MVPPKLVKLATSILCQSLSSAINNSLSKGIFLDDAKIAMVSPLAKVLLIRMIHRVFDLLVFQQRSQKYVKELVKN